MQGLTIHDINIIVVTMFWGYIVFVYIFFVYELLSKASLYSGFWWYVSKHFYVDVDATMFTYSPQRHVNLSPLQ